MRTLLTGERATIAAARVQHLIKVEVTDADGVYRDWSSFLISAKWSETIDQPVAQATITLRRAEGTSSLAPTMVGSPLNRNAAAAYAAAIDLARFVRISTATINPGDTPSYREMFLGRIDDIDWAADPIQLTCSDLGAFLMDTQIEAENDYWSNDGATVNSAATGGALGTTAPVAVEAVIQKIIGDWPNGLTSPVLYTPTSPAWRINPYKQAKDKVFEAIRNLSLQIGWDLRYRYDASHVSRLTLLDPGRASSAVMATIGPAEYSNVKKLSIEMADVRNAGLVGFLDAGGKRQNVTYSDPVSILKFGRRYMELAPGDNIKTSSDALRYLQASINDLSGAPAEQDVEMLYFWPVQIYDRYLFSANGDHYDTDQTLSVVGYEHAFENGQGITTLTCAGRVIGSYADWLRRSHGAAPADIDLSILRWSQTESSDKTLDLFSLVVGALVETVHVHYRTVPIDADGDTTNFSGDEDVVESPTLLIKRSDANRNVSFAIPNPPRNLKVAGRMIPVGASLASGESIPFYVYPAPPALNAAIRATRTDDKVSLAVDVAWGPSDADPALGAFVQVAQDTLTTSTNLVARNVLAPGTLNSATDATLGNIQLPGGKDFLTFRVIITDVSGEAWPLAVIHVARDPLSEATATLLNYRAQPATVIVFGPDTDTIRVTSHDGVTTTISTSGRTSPFVYTLGSTIRDDASTETALTVDETRSGFKVEAQGGGTWITILGPVDLHGQPKNPPTALVTATPNANGDAEDVTVTPNTATTEKLHVYFRDGSTDSALQWFACVSAGDPTKLSVVAGTVIGPANFFMRVDGVGSPTAKLSALPAAVDQLSRYGVMIEGAESGIQSPWLPVTISLMAKPWNQSLDAVFLESTGNLHVVLVTGPRCLFEEVDIADNASFTSPTTQTVVTSGTPGQQIAFDFALGLAQHGKKFYVRAKPNNKTTGLGLDGDYQVATVDVGALFDCQPSYAETVTTGMVTLAITDPSGVLNTAAVDSGITAAISWHVTKLGVTTIEASTSVPAGGATTGTYTKSIALDPLHTISVSAFVHLKDGSTAPLGPWPFDSNKISDLWNSDSAVSGAGGANEDFTLQWDSDTRVGANCARYSLDGGATWTTVTVTSGLLAQFSVARTSSVQSMLVQAQNAIDGNWGNQSTLKVSVFSSAGPVYSVQLLANNPDSTHDKILWSCSSGVALLSIDGGSFSTPSPSPITVAKPATGRHTYVFQFSNGGISVTDEVDVLPVSADTITPNLDATLGTPTSTTLPITVTASNPVSGGAAPSISVKCVGCTMTVSGTTYADGTTLTSLASGTVVTGNRSSTTTATMAQLEIVATLGGASERIVVAVPPQTAFGPTLTVNATPGSSSYSISWAGTGIITLSIDGGTFSTPAYGSPHTVTRDANDHTYTFSAFADGQTIQQTVVIPALGSSGGGSGTFTSLSTAVHSTGAGTSSIRVTFAFSTSASFDVYTNDPGYTGDPSGNTYAVAPSGSGASSPFDCAVTENLSPNPLGTASPVDIGFYVVAYSGVSEIGRSTKNVNTYQTDV